MAIASNAQDPSTFNSLRSAQPFAIPPLTVEEEEDIIHTRITNDERPLRRVIKKFHNYASLAHASVVPPAGSPGSVEDAREAFLVEIASFQLSLKKSAMICEAEARQVEEYYRERQRIDDEHGTLRAQIEELKTALEHAQVLRRRKMEYDLVAEKVNTLPSREELERSIQSLESDVAAIHAEHETQARIIQGQKAALDSIVSDLGSLRLMGKEQDTATPVVASPRDTPLPEETVSDTPVEVQDIVELPAAKSEEPGEEREEGEEEKYLFDDRPPSPLTEDDIEMGEVAEDPKDNKLKKKIREELEEGEASDTSSALSDPPDDI